MKIECKNFTSVLDTYPNMFAYNDDVPLEDRSRLFNIYIAHELKERMILHENDLSTIIFTYMTDLQNDTALCGFRSYQEVVKWIHSHDGDHLLTDSVIDILTDINPNKVKIGHLILGPCGTPSFSAYGFGKDDVLENSPILLGECPEYPSHNPWFSRKILIFQFKQIIPKSRDFEINEIIEDTPTNNLLVVGGAGMEYTKTYTLHIPFDQIEHFYEVNLLARDQYKQIQQSLKDVSHGTLLYVADNYHILYPLIVHYQKKDNHYVWSFPKST